MNYDIQLASTQNTVRKPGAEYVLVNPTVSDIEGYPSDVVLYRRLSPQSVIGSDEGRAGHDNRGPTEQYRYALEQKPDLLTPLMQMARKGPVVLLYEETHGPPDYLLALRDSLRVLLQLEDRQCGIGEPSSPTCFFGDGDGE